MPFICEIDALGHYIRHRVVQPTDPAPPGWLWMDPPVDPSTPNILDGGTWRSVDAVHLPPTKPLPINPRVSKKEFRDLLKPKEVMWFDEKRATSTPLTLEERDELFDTNTSGPELQIKGAVREALLQFELVTAIELDHQDTLQFLQVMALDGMFGADAQTRIPQILSRQSPT